MVYITNFGKILKFSKNVPYVLGGVLIGMCTKFQVDIFEYNVFKAFETSKFASFHDIPMHYQTIMFFVSTSCSLRPTWF